MFQNLYLSKTYLLVQTLFTKSLSVKFIELKSHVLLLFYD